jgi:hypothetical protein
MMHPQDIRPRVFDPVELLTRPTLVDIFEQAHSTPLMRWLHAILWALVVFVAAMLTYFHFTDPAPGNAPSRSAPSASHSNQPSDRAEAVGGQPRGVQ